MKIRSFVEIPVKQLNNICDQFENLGDYYRYCSLYYIFTVIEIIYTQTV